MDRPRISVCPALLLVAALSACNRQAPQASDDSTPSLTSSSGYSGASGSGATGAPANTAAPGARSSGTSGSSAAGGLLDDSVLTGKAKTALLADSDLRSLDISVETKNGEVSLSGHVMNQAQIDRALKVAGNVEGVKGVQNRLSIQR